MTTYVRRSTANKTQQATLRNTAHTTRVFGYCRVSTDMQAQQGLSLDDQREAIKQFAADRGWTVEEIFVDGGFSAKNTDRPAFQRMMREIKNSDGGIAAVVVTKLDRLTRSLRDLCSINEDLLEPFGCNLVAIRDGINTFEPVSKMLLPFLAIIGQIERQNTGERALRKGALRLLDGEGREAYAARRVSEDVPVAAKGDRLVQRGRDDGGDWATAQRGGCKTALWRAERMD